MPDPSSSPGQITPLTPAAGAMEQRRTPTLLAGAAPRQDAVRVWSPDAKILHSKARGFIASMACIYLGALLSWLEPHWPPAPINTIILMLAGVVTLAGAFWFVRNVGSVPFQLFGLPYCVSTDAEGVAVAGYRRSDQRRWSEITSCVYQRVHGRIAIYAEGKAPVIISLAGYSDEDRDGLADTIIEKAALPICDSGRGLQEIYGKPVGMRVSFLSRIPYQFFSLGGLIPIENGTRSSSRSSRMLASRGQSAITGPEHASAAGPELRIDED